MQDFKWTITGVVVPANIRAQKPTFASFFYVLSQRRGKGSTSVFPRRQEDILPRFSELGIGDLPDQSIHTESTYNMAHRKNFVVPTSS